MKVRFLFGKIERQLAVAQQIVGAPMIGRDAIFADGSSVFLGGVALVGAPVVLWIFLGQTIHVVVAVGLGQDGCSRDGEIFAVALDDGGPARCMA